MPKCGGLVYDYFPPYYNLPADTFSPAYSVLIAIVSDEVPEK